VVEAYIKPMTVVQTCFAFTGIEVATTTKLPVSIPALPIPTTALPTMSAVDDGARAQRSDPVTKINIESMYDHLVEYVANT
jgi:hypothetical protein